MKKICIFFTIIVLSFSTIFFVCCNREQDIQRNCYTITADYDDVNHTLNAKMEVVYVNNSDAILDELCFHLYPNAYRKDAQFKAVDESVKDSAYTKGESYGGIQILSVEREERQVEWDIEGEDDDILVVEFINELEPTQKTTIDIEFVVSLPQVKHRLGYIGNVANFGNWYPIACKKIENGFDTSPYYSNGDPFWSDCSDYNVSITVPSQYIVATSGKSEKKENGIITTYTSFLQNARDFAFVVGDFSTQSAKVGNTEVIYYYKNDTDAQSSLKCAMDALEFFSQKFGAYPYPTYSVVETNFVYGGMEYPSLVYISNSLNKSMSKEAIIHETAHQWWYAIVGNDQVNHAWMDEGLAEYCTTLFYEFNPSYNVTYKQRMADAISAYVVYSDVSSYDGVMERNVGEFSSFDYTYITYLKGALMFDTIRKSVGDTAFFSALKSYRNAYEFSSATPSQMINSFEKSTNRQLKGLFESFLYGKTGVY